MKTTTQYPDFEVVELTNEDAAEALSDLSGLELEPMAESEQERVQRVLGPARRDDAWAKVRRDVDRAHAEEIRWGDHG